MAGRMPFSSSMPEMFDPYAAIRPAYMRRPVERPAAYYFLRTILIAGGIAGGLIALYRNDVLLELSRRVGQESRYFQLEQYLGMSPGWGTPRSMQEVLEGQPVAAEHQRPWPLLPRERRRPDSIPWRRFRSTRSRSCRGAVALWHPRKLHPPQRPSARHRLHVSPLPVAKRVQWRLSSTASPTRNPLRLARVKSETSNPNLTPRP
jgi:hypothetical protein